MFQWLEELCGVPSHSPLFSLVFISLVTLYLLKFMTRSQTRKLTLPPSPPKLPIIGNLHQLGFLPHRSLQFLAQKYGPLMFLHLGQTPTLIVSSADGAREVLKAQDVNFSNRPTMNFAKKLVYSNKNLAFSSYGDYWKQMRRICVSHLLSAHRVESFRPIREEEANLMVDKIRQKSSYSSTSSVLINLSDILFSYSNDVICRVTLGRKFGEDEGGRKFQKMISEFLYFVGVFDVGDFIPWLSWVNRLNGFNARVDKNFIELDRFFESVIEEHITCRKKDNNGVEDFVDVLLDLEKEGSVGVPFGKDNMKALILDMFAAGTDSSSTTLVWAMTELMRHGEIMKEVQIEIREIAKQKTCITEDDLEKMHKLKMVIKETLRLHVPGPLLLPHQSMQDAKLQGYDIPAKTTVVVNAWAIARDPLSWEDPEEFRPKRFLKSSADYKGKDFNYIPFGAGRRGCPGILFASPSIELPLANLLYHFDWNLPNGATSGEMDVTEGSGASAYKKTPLILVATPHRFVVTT